MRPVHRRWIACLTALVAWTAILACSDSGPRQDLVPYNTMMRWNDVLTVKVIESWDLVKHHADTAPQATHAVEVRVLEGPPAYVGKEFTLPYDSWATGSEPPGSGSEVVMTPASWVTPRASSRGAPHPSWQR